MGYILSQPELSKIRTALSDAFVDAPVDYDYIAEQVRGFELQTVNEVLYSEVAPVCFTNIESAVPPVWTGFEPDSLNAMIEERLAAREKNWFQRRFDKVLVAWLRYRYADIWKEITNRL